MIERKSAMETGLEVLVRNAAKRLEEAEKACEDHEAIHLAVTTARIAAGCLCRNGTEVSWPTFRSSPG